MPKMVQVRDVSDAVHQELIRQAAEARMSLNRFLLQELERLARRGRNAALVHRASQRRGRRLRTDQVVNAVREDRDHGR